MSAELDTFFRRFNIDIGVSAELKSSAKDLIKTGEDSAKSSR
jgi:hypothetical protein